MTELYWPCSSDNSNSTHIDLPATKKKKKVVSTNAGFWIAFPTLHISAVPACNVLQVYEYIASMELEEERFLKGVTREIENNM